MQMTSLRRVCVALAALLLSGGLCGPATHALQQLQPVVQHIDHVMIRAQEPSELYAFFVDTLQLPVAWPLAERGGVTSGGVGFGNVNVEAIRFPGQIDEPGPAHLVGFAFEPVALEKSLAELKRRGIEYGEPRPFVTTAPDGTRTTSFTNVTLSRFSDADRPGAATLHVFLSEYNPVYVDAEQRRARLRKELAARDGGPLGIRGPAIRLVHADKNLVQGLLVRVASLERARAFLKEQKLLGSASETRVTIAPSRLHGVNIVLFE